MWKAGDVITVYVTKYIMNEGLIYKKRVWCTDIEGFLEDKSSFSSGLYIIGYDCFLGYSEAVIEAEKLRQKAILFYEKSIKAAKALSFREYDPTTSNKKVNYKED